jgi:hypothetical protein
MRKEHRELMRYLTAHGIEGVRFVDPPYNAKHPHLLLPNGRKVTVPNSPRVAGNYSTTLQNIRRLMQAAY